MGVEIGKGTLAILASSLILLPTIEFSELMSSSKVSGLWVLIILQLLILIKKSFKNKAQNEIWSDFEIGVLCYNTSQL